jgi:hypothetical protein
MMRLNTIILVGATALVLCARAEAQQSYPIQEMNFDMWCQEEKHLSPDRCDKRLPDDDAEFEAYRATIEKYEIPYLQKQEQDDNLNQVIIHGDPLDRPPQPSTAPSAAGSTPCSGIITCGGQLPQQPSTAGGTTVAGTPSSQ